MSTKISPKNEFLAFFYNNNSVRNVIYKNTFNNYRTIYDEPIILNEEALNEEKIKKMQEECEKGFKTIGLNSQKLEKNASELGTFLGHIERITKFKQPSSVSKKKEKKNFRNFLDFTNFIGNVLCLPISKILEIFYCNLNFEKPTFEVNVRREFRDQPLPPNVGSEKTIFSDTIYSKSIKLEPDITIKKPSKINAKKAFILIACVIATLAIPILIGLGIVLKLIAQKKDAVIKKDYETLKDFFKPKDRNISTGAFDGPISEQKHLENAFKYQNLKNTIIGTLTIKAEHSKGFCIADALLKEKNTKISDLFVKTLVLRIENSMTEKEINKYQVPGFKRLPPEKNISKGHVFTFVKK